MELSVVSQRLFNENSFDSKSGNFRSRMLLTLAFSLYLKREIRYESYHESYSNCLVEPLPKRPRLPPGHTRIQSWYHSKFQVILATFSPLIPKLCSDKSESGGKWILVSHWLISSILMILNQWENRIVLFIKLPQFNAYFI